MHAGLPVVAIVATNLGAIFIQIAARGADVLVLVLVFCPKSQGITVLVVVVPIASLTIPWESFRILVVAVISTAATGVVPIVVHIWVTPAVHDARILGLLTFFSLAARRLAGNAALSIGGGSARKAILHTIAEDSVATVVIRGAARRRRLTGCAGRVTTGRDHAKNEKKNDGGSENRSAHKEPNCDSMCPAERGRERRQRSTSEKWHLRLHAYAPRLVGLRRQK
jgi:hypothetical protein